MKSGLFNRFLINFKNNYYTKIVTLFFGTIAISCLLLLFVFAIQQAQKSEEQRISFDKNSFDQFFQIMERKVVSDIYALGGEGLFTVLPYNTLTTYNTKNPFIYRQNPFDSTLIYKDQLFNLHQNFPYIKSIDLYSKTYDTFISSTGGVFYNVSQRQDELEKIVPFHVFQAAKKSEDSQFWVMPTSNKDFSPYTNTASFVLCQPLFFTASEYEMMFIINVNPALIINDYFKNQMLFDSHFFIINSQNEVFLTTSSTEYLDEVLADSNSAEQLHSETSGVLNVQLKTGGHSLLWKKSEFNNWKYLYLSKDPEMLSILSDTLKFIAFWFILITAVCGVFSVVVSRVLYKPIGALLNTANIRMGKSNEKINEIKEISEAFSTINKQLHKYETTITKNSPLLLNNIAHNLLDGNVYSVDDLNSWLSILNQYFNYSFFYFFIIKLDSEVFNALTYKERDFIQLSVRELIEGRFAAPMGNKLKVISHYSPQGHITFIINTASEEEYKKERQVLPSLLKNLSQEFTEIFNFGVSPVIRDLSEFNAEYKRVQTFFKYGFIYGNSNIFDKELIDVYDNNTGIYDTASIKNMKNLLSESKFEELKREIAGFYAEIKEKNYSYLYTHAISLQIIGLFIHEFNQNNLPLPSIGDADLVTSFSKLTNIESCANWYGDIIDIFAEALQDRSANINNSYMQSILTFINENITRVSLNSVSEEFKISTGHLSRIFKKQLGINFSDYISTEKMEYACKLLSTTNMKIADIAMELSYFNVNYFNKIFKAKYNMTPGQYRKENNNQSP